MARKKWVKYYPNSAITQLYKKHPTDEYKCSCGSTNLRRLKKEERVRDYMVRCQDCGMKWIIQKSCVHCGMNDTMWNGCQMHVLRTDNPGTSIIICNRCLKFKHNLRATRRRRPDCKRRHPATGEEIVISGGYEYGLEPYSKEDQALVTI